MKKIFKVAIVILTFAMALTACTNKSEEHINSLTYSNLFDSSVQDEVRNSMELAGISSENIENFFKDVNNFNDRIKGKDLVKEGFVTIDNINPEYDVAAIGDMWNKEDPIFIGHNCRLTTFSLMKDLISIENKDTKNSQNLFMDIDAIENSPKEIFNKSEQEEFETLFSFILTDNTKDISIHLDKVKKDWENKGVKFSKDSKASFISIFFHSYEDSQLFIGHAGILLPAKDNKLLFVEKLSFQEPYQAIKFDNRVELNDYLMGKYDVSWDQSYAKPFIMENDELLEGYRENQNSKEDID